MKLHAGRDGPERLVIGDRRECDARGFANRSLSGHRLQRVELPGGGEVRQALGEALEAGIDAGELPSDLDINAIVNMLIGSSTPYTSTAGRFRRTPPAGSSRTLGPPT
jgi:hypothetical protein